MSKSVSAFDEQAIHSRAFTQSPPATLSSSIPSRAAPEKEHREIVRTDTTVGMIGYQFGLNPPILLPLNIIHYTDSRIECQAEKADWRAAPRGHPKPVTTKAITKMTTNEISTRMHLRMASTLSRALLTRGCCASAQMYGRKWRGAGGHCDVRLEGELAEGVVGRNTSRPSGLRQRRRKARFHTRGAERSRKQLISLATFSICSAVSSANMGRETNSSAHFSAMGKLSLP